MNKKEENIAIRKCQQGEIANSEVLVHNYQLPALRSAYLLLTGLFPFDSSNQGSARRK